MGEMDEVVGEFLVESYENLDQLDRDLVSLEQDPRNTETLSSVFRTIHTIKGTCGFLGFNKLESVTHVGENLLTKLRDGSLIIDPPITTALLSMIDSVREMLSNIEATEAEGDGDYGALVATLGELAKGEEKEEKDEGGRMKDEGGDGVASDASISADGGASSDAAPNAPAEEEPAEEEPARLGDLLVEQGHASPEAVVEAASEQAAGDPRHIGEILVDKGEVEPGEVKKALQQQGEARRSISESSIRVDVGLLDKLMNLVGELVLARNQILQFTTTTENPALIATSQHLNLITTELQEGVMKTRMQPIGNVWSKFPRVVRDLALACDKKVRIVMEGKETELDKTIIEAIKDPLTHVVRNSMDHGFESPADRVAAGKPAEGTLTLKAYHEGGQVIIEISDDGGGVNHARVKAKAIEKGVITTEQASRMSEREIANLVFAPGFSTAVKVTNVSGRGVGMDVVRTNIEKIGGTVDLTSKAGLGTTLKIKIPLTLAIIPALVVTNGGQRFAIPQVSLLELVRLGGEQAVSGIETIHGAPVYRLRGDLLPLVYLNEVLGMGEEERRGDAATRGGGEDNGDAGRRGGGESEEFGGNRGETAGPADDVNIVVLQADDQPFGLVVEGIHDTEEIVVKPMGRQIKDISVFAGATIMGDGKVALILDVMGIAQHSGVLREHRDSTVAEASGAATEAGAERTAMLLFRLGAERRMAIPLSMVARLEEFDRSAVERVGDQSVVQYRGRIMPLIALGEVVGMPKDAAAEPSDKVQVVVYATGDTSVGLVVDRIEDIVEEALEIKLEGGGRGLLGSAVIQDRVTELLDVKDVVRSLEPSIASIADAAAA